MSNLRLSIELVPKTSWFGNVRSAVTSTRWKAICKRVYSSAYDTCEICGGIGPKHPVECHEIWSYDDDKKLQQLKGMIALCPDCHMVKHYGFAQVSGKEEKALRHFMKVNKLTKAKAQEYVTAAFTQWAIRSCDQWQIDISILSEYGIDVKQIKRVG